MWPSFVSTLPNNTGLLLNVAKCNLGKVNLEAMLSSNLWMQEAHLQPWRFAGALCDAYTQ